MHHLVYASSSKNLMPLEELNSILEKARVSNSANNITGLLLYNDGNFLQVLEGEKGLIHSCYNKISKDPRHRGIITLLDEPISYRSFEEWSMAFISYNDLTHDQRAGFSNVVSLVKNANEDKVSSSQLIVRTYLKMFKMI
jgi:hypothetical protein